MNAAIKNTNTAAEAIALYGDILENANTDAHLASEARDAANDAARKAKTAAEAAEEKVKTVKAEAERLYLALRRADRDEPTFNEATGWRDGVADRVDTRRGGSFRTTFGRVFVTLDNTSGVAFRWTATGYTEAGDVRGSVTLFEPARGTSNADRVQAQYAEAMQAARDWIATRTARAILEAEYGIGQDVELPTLAEQVQCTSRISDSWRYGPSVRYEILTADGRVKVASLHGAWDVMPHNKPGAERTAFGEALEACCPVKRPTCPTFDGTRREWHEVPHEEQQTYRKALEAFGEAMRPVILAAWIEREEGSN